MNLTLVEKLISEHLVDGEMIPGSEIGIKIDQTLTQDATGTLVYLQFEAMNLDRIKTELSVSYVDHNTLQSDYKNMDDHLYLQSVAARYGIYFSRPGNGICHQVHLERFGVPGKTLLGSDSHTPTAGGLCMIGIGAGGLNVAAALAGAPFYLKMPEIVGIKLTGELKPMCSAKDVILTLLGKESVKGGVGVIYEYFGEGVETLSVPERATITNMGAELGATTSIFPSDDLTKDFLKLQKREEVWKQLLPDKGANYSRVIHADLKEIVPQVACPHMPDKVVPVCELKDMKVDQVVIGSCTNSSINDLGIASDILSGKTIADHVSLGICPGSRQVFQAAIKAGIIFKLVKSGARILELACGPCIGMGFAPCSGGVSVRTNNRNFKARSGTEDAKVYLVSPETAAATALKGSLTDPREIKEVIKKDYSEYITIDDSMIITPPEEGKKIKVIRGPNIKPCPVGKSIKEKISAKVVLKTGDNITTDHIMPAGSKILPLRSNIPEISKHVFEILDPGFYNRVKDVKNGVIIGGENYGQGSSREHAALAPMFLGIKIVIAKSFARIHKENLVNFGIIPLIFTHPDDYNVIEIGDVIAFKNDIDKALLLKKNIKMSIENKKRELVLYHDLSKRLIDIILEGGLLNYTKL